MSLDLEDELRLAMQEYTNDLQAPPDLMSRLPWRRPRAFQRLAVVAAAAAAAVTVAGVVWVGERTGGGGTGAAVKALSTYHVPKTTARQEQRAASQMDEAIDRWGPPRGDRAGDTTLLSRLRAEWAHPTQHPANLGGFEPVQAPDGPVKILWAGTTPEGVAAVAAQHTKDPVAQYWYGIFLPDAGGTPRLAQRTQLIGGADFGELDPNMLSFTTSPAHRSVVVVPVDPADTVRISFTTTIRSDGTLVPAWRDAPVRNDAAVATVPGGGSVWGTVVEVSHGGQVVAHHRLDFVSTHLLNEGPPQPSNVLPLWCNGCAVGDGGPGYTLAMLTAWELRHGPAYLPVWTSGWSIGGRLPDGASVLAMQMWTIGRPARTVVMIDDEARGEISVLYDAETTSADRPLVAVRLPGSAGWLVGAGPDAVVTGWRTSPEASWRAVANKKALLVPTDATSIQLRMVVQGNEQVATR
jgi:hypothetical protein